MKAIMPFIYTLTVAGLVGVGLRFVLGPPTDAGATVQGMAQGLLLAAILYWTIRGPIKQ